MHHEKTVAFDTSDRDGKDYCGEACEHLELSLKFPETYICKITGVTLQPDRLRRLKRPDACKYTFGEEAPDRFWSPLRES